MTDVITTTHVNLLNEKLANTYIGKTMLTKVVNAKVPPLLNNGFLYMGYDNSKFGTPLGVKKMFIIHEIEKDIFYDVNKINKVINDYNKTLDTHGEDYIRIFVMFNDCGDIEKNPLNDNFYFTIDEIKLIHEENQKEIERRKIEAIVETEDVSTFKFNDKDVRQTYKKFANDNAIWELCNHEFTSQNIVGRVVHLCSQFKPLYSNTFVSNYHEYAETHKDRLMWERGLTKNEMCELTEKFYRRITEVKGGTNPMTKKEAYDYLMYHIVIHAFDGYCAEHNFMAVCELNSITVNKTDKEADQYYGIDVMLNSNKFKGGVAHVQIKSINYLQYQFTKKISKLEDLYAKALYKYNVPTIYAFYKQDEDGKFQWLINPKNDTYTFSLDEIKKWDKIKDNNTENVI